MGQFESIMRDSLNPSQGFSEELFTEDMVEFVVENKHRTDLIDDKLIKYCIQRKKGQHPPLPEVDEETQKAFVSVYIMFQRMKLIAQ